MSSKYFGGPCQLDRQPLPTVPSVIEFQRFTGLGDFQLGSAALAKADTDQLKASLALSLGLLFMARGQNDRARELFEQALPLYERIRDAYSQAITHAWLARVTDGAEHRLHCSRLDELAARVTRPGFRDALRSISGC